MPAELMPVELPVCSTAEDYQTLLNYTRMFSRTRIVWAQTPQVLQADKYYAALKRQVLQVLLHAIPKSCYTQR